MSKTARECRAGKKVHARLHGASEKLPIAIKETARECRAGKKVRAHLHGVSENLTLCHKGNSAQTPRG